MLNKLLCWLIGHKWTMRYTGSYVCERCLHDPELKKGR